MHESIDRDAILAGLGVHPRLGIIGGGQLASMTAAAARPLGCDVFVLERYAFSPAAHMAGDTMIGDWNDADVVRRFAGQVDVLTLENEFVDVDALTRVDTDGRCGLRKHATLRLIQDKYTQKQTLSEAGLPVAPFRAVESVEALMDALRAFGVPAVLKARRNGYDGKGNVTIRNIEDAPRAWATLDGDRQALYVEAFCAFTRELATIVTRGRDGATVVYPIVETIQRDHICHMVLAPAAIPDAVAARASAMATSAIAAIDGVGSFGVEMFELADGTVLINELAPRVHNSGHYTIEACACSQFENHVRAVFGLPLGSPAMVRPAAVMINLLGHGSGSGAPLGMAAALAVPGAHVHVYGKAQSSRGRKMGHVTALGENISEARATAERAASALTFGAMS